jgi:O-antigen/teichoic acid export membrane protein
VNVTPPVAARTGLASVTRGTIFLLVATLCTVGLTFAARVLIVRTISPSEWSAFSFDLTLSQVLVSFGALGLPLAVARSLPYAASDEERRAMVRVSLWVGGVAAVVAGAALWFAAPAIGTTLGSSLVGAGLRYFAVAVTALTAANLLASVFQGYTNVTPNAVFLQIANPAMFLAFLGFALLVVPGKITYVFALAAYALAGAITLVALVSYTVPRLPHHLPPGPEAPEARRHLLRLAVPLFVMGTMTSLANSGDTLVLGFFHPADVGTYVASLTLARLVLIGINSAAYILLPVAAGTLRVSGRGSVRLIYATVTKWLTTFSLPLALLFLVLPSRSLDFVYGASYATVVRPLEVTVLGAFAATLIGPSSTVLVALGRTRSLVLNAATCGVLDVALSVALVPSQGYLGAAIAWAVANLLFDILCLAQVARVDLIHPFQRAFLLPLAITSLPLGAVLYVAGPHLPVWSLPPIGIGVALAFVLVVVGTRSYGDGDRLLLESVEGLLGRPLPWVRRLVGRSTPPAR